MLSVDVVLTIALQVMQVDSVIPLPSCKDLDATGPNKRLVTGQRGGDAGVRTQSTSPSAAPAAAEDTAGEGGVSATAPASAPATATASTTAEKGSDDHSGGPLHVTGGRTPAASVLSEAANSGAGRNQQRPSVGSRAWEGVFGTVDVEMAVSSDTEDPTDSESGSDSEPEYADDIDKNIGSDRAVPSAAHVVEGGPRSEGGETSSGGVGGEGERDHPLVLVADVPAPQLKSQTLAAGAAAGPPPSRPRVARLRGGGGGDGSGDDSDDAGAKHMMAWRDGEQTDGWSMVESAEVDASDDGDGNAGAKGAAGETCVAGEAGCPEGKQERNGEQEERMVQWEFVNGYLEEVGQICFLRTYVGVRPFVCLCSPVPVRSLKMCAFLDILIFSCLWLGFPRQKRAKSCLERC